MPKCDQCGRQMANEITLSRHKTNGPNGGYVCEGKVHIEYPDDLVCVKCDRKLGSRGSYKIHFLADNCHKDIEVPEDRTCVTCKHQYANKYTYLAHIKSGCRVKSAADTYWELLETKVKADMNSAYIIDLAKLMPDLPLTPKRLKMSKIEKNIVFYIDWIAEACHINNADLAKIIRTQKETACIQINKMANDHYENQNKKNMDIYATENGKHIVDENGNYFIDKKAFDSITLLPEYPRVCKYYDDLENYEHSVDKLPDSHLIRFLDMKIDEIEIIKTIKSLSRKCPTSNILEAKKKIWEIYIGQINSSLKTWNAYAYETNKSYEGFHRLGKNLEHLLLTIGLRETKFDTKLMKALEHSD